MTATNPTAAKTHDATTWDGADGSEIASYLAGLTDGNIAITQVSQGLAPDDILRIELPNKSTIAVGDTVTVWVGTEEIDEVPSALINYGTMALLPYDAAGTVTTGNKITVTAAVGVNLFTLTQAFIDDLFDQGSGTWAARIVEDGEISGFAGISEVDSDLTTEGGGGSPGGLPGNAPAGYKYLKDDRMNRIRAIRSAPKSERQWTAFIRNLGKLVKNETGTFDISSTDTAKFTGFSTDPTTSSIWWHRYGQIVHLEFNIGTGTSDATDFTVTEIPTVLRPRDDCTYPLFGLYDNGAALTSGSIKVGSDGTLTFYTDHEDGAWTGSSTKGFTTGLGAKGFMYSLREPQKL